MFNLIVSNRLKDERSGLISAERVLEHTSAQTKAKFKPDGKLDILAVKSLPTIFMEEGTRNEVALIGWLTKVKHIGFDYQLHYSIDQDFPSMTNAKIVDMAADLEIYDNFEFSRNHWAIKDADLFQALYRQKIGQTPTPTVFKISSKPVDPKLISFMMPFSSEFTSVYDDVKEKLEDFGYWCQRADDMWIHSEIMTDIIELICTSTVIVCDLSNKNPNVFYEAGIAHTLGKEVILITQSDDDVPFDLRSFRYLKYLNNAEGRAKLASEVTKRVRNLT